MNSHRVKTQLIIFLSIEANSLSIFIYIFDLKNLNSNRLFQVQKLVVKEII